MWGVGEDILKIWGVHKGSPAAFKGEFGNDPQHRCRPLRVAGRRRRGDVDQG